MNYHLVSILPGNGFLKMVRNLLLKYYVIGMFEELVTMLENVMSKITDSSNMGRTGYDSAKNLRNELALYKEELKKGNADCLNELNIHFLPTSTFQEHSLENNWADEYLELSEQFDRIYAQSKNSG